MGNVNREWNEWESNTATWSGSAGDILFVPQDKECVVCKSDEIFYHEGLYSSYMVCLECNAKWSPTSKLYKRNYNFRSKLEGEIDA